MSGAFRIGRTVWTQVLVACLDAKMVEEFEKLRIGRTQHVSLLSFVGIPMFDRRRKVDVPFHSRPIRKTCSP